MGTLLCIVPFAGISGGAFVLLVGLWALLRRERAL